MRKITPEIIQFEVSIQTNGTTLSIAQSENSKEYQKLKSTLLEAGLKESDIKTSSFYKSII